MAKAGKAGKSRSSAKKKRSGLDLGKFLDEVRFGNFKLDDVLEGTNKNLQAIADANRAIVDGYVETSRKSLKPIVPRRTNRVTGWQFGFLAFSDRVNQALQNSLGLL